MDTIKSECRSLTTAKARIEGALSPSVAYDRLQESGTDMELTK
jgi:hypothetical protein